MIRLVAVAAALAGCREHAEPRDLHVATPELAAPTAAPHLYAAAPGSFVDVVAGARHGVVAIHAAQPVKSGPAAMFPGSPESVADVALGTGFLIEAKGVYVVTNDHIAAASNELRVVLPDRTVVPAKLVGRDVALDVALLSIEAPRLQALPLGDSDDLAVGEWIVALGDPFGDEVSASAGIVSSTGREAAGSLEPVRALGFRTYIQTDARIHRGNSGGPVLNTAGQVIGVAVATGDRPGELSFVLPIDRVREVLDALRDVGQVSRSWLGVLVKPVTPELASSLALPRPTGALVTELEPGSPAARAGLRAGDIILKWGEHDVDHRSLPWLVSAAPAGKPVTVEVWRDRTDVPIAVVPERMPQ